MPCEEAKWALYKDTQAADDKCEECYQLWRGSFSHMLWPEVTAKHTSDREFQQLIQEAREVRFGDRDRPEKVETVVKKQTVGLRIIRTFVCLSEKEMRRASNLSRIPKMPLKHIPTIEAPSECGGPPETLFCFQDPAQPYRRAEVVVHSGVESCQDVLPFDSFAWEGQGKAYWKKEVKETGDASGLINLVNKEVYLPEWESFMHEKLVHGGGETEDEGVPEQTPANNPEAAGSAFSGVAAADVAGDAASATPRPVRKPVVVDSSVESKALRKSMSSRTLVEESAEAGSAGDSTFADAEELEGQTCS